ncbi:hypothetical protein JL09_g6653 [Pichia kudriavzevii]|uniref:Uncharacterized protein n=1 Tax=Pichia kudriavzevii TaxID=4909 RepID=A0A099NJJ4_PICKU|nr:hypothetical protein JL09_g6658 [Pichia kudriavzevii]KGK32740.1 hypothetical protein JL09_g6653 [Pichia kudriavzevii]
MSDFLETRLLSANWHSMRQKPKGLGI